MIQTPNINPYRTHGNINISMLMINTFSGPGGGNGNVTWPAASLACFVPIVILFNDAIVPKAWWMNGNIISGNIDVGVYDENYILLASTGSVAQSGTTILQTANLNKEVVLYKNKKYYFSLTLSSAATRLQTITLLYSGILGVLTQTSVFPLPATAVPNGLSAYLPFFGFYEQGF